MFLSVIIPCYRESEEQLGRCLDSLAFLSKLCEWEAWIIDDGSAEAKVESWLQKRGDSHLHVVRQENQGQGAARNTGIEMSKGEYIAFVDADDELIPGKYEEVMQLVIQEKPDMVGLRYKETKTPYYDGDALRFMERNDVVPSACAYIIRREALRDLRFTPGIFHEDEEFVTFLHVNAGRLIMTPIVAYQYNVHPGTTMTSTDHEHLNKRFNDYIGVIKRVKKSVPNEGMGRAMLRRTHTMAMCYLVNLMRDAYSNAFIKEKLSMLKRLHLYPLPKRKGIRRYGMIRAFTRYQWMVMLNHKILRRSR